MCLGIPGRVVAIVPGFADQLALVDVRGAERRVNIGMLDSRPGPGDWVLIHMGFAVELIDEASAEEALSGLELMGRPREPVPAAAPAPSWARDLGWETGPDAALESGPAPDSGQAPALDSGPAPAPDSGPVADGERIRCRYTVSGLVQGVGFRPFAYALAAGLALAGQVLNTAAGVLVEVEGDPAAVREYGRRLRTDAPPLAMVATIDAEEQPARGGTGFTIGASAGDGAARTLASPDVAICADCRRELTDPADRRYRHPFITCTNCGPRFTIIENLPYDRAATTMATFPMCATCRAEYRDPADRRFHAQPIACPDCGPRLELVTAAEEGDPPTGRVDFGRAYGPNSTHAEDGEPPTGRVDLGGVYGPDSTHADVVGAARRLLAEGRIVAVKGLGGYHLACDAGNGAAVAELRRRKRRGGQPFAIMVRDRAVARRLVDLTPGEEALLDGVRKPIVLAAKATGAGVAAEVAPGQADLGVMLPYTPLHVLLFGLEGDPPGPDALVMTSGNLSGEPIVTGDEEALTRLGPLADAWLRHDRAIRVPCDDSVSRHVAGAELPIRRSRGYAPLPIALPFDVPPILAAGADLKNTCAVAAGRYAWVSPHLGDMDDVATIDALTRTADHLAELTGVHPEILVADRHPDYRSGDWARRQARDRPLRLVQHHHAHIASVLAEHGVGPDEQVIGMAFDGTGYGTDCAVWGGEVLIAGYKSFERAFHLGYVPLAGGDASVQRPYRMALSHLRAAGVPWHPDLPPVAACPPDERRLLDRQFASGAGCVPTSSMGRLFDAVAALAGVRQISEYEAEAALLLEGAARSGSGDGYRFELSDGIADPAPVIRAVAADVLAGVPAADVAARFHTAVTGLIAELAVAARRRTGLDVVALGGGVFQNALLIEQAGRALADRGFTVLRPRLLPPNDGGLALGQIAAGAW